MRQHPAEGTAAERIAGTCPAGVDVAACVAGEVAAVDRQPRRDHWGEVTHRSEKLAISERSEIALIPPVSGG